MGETFCPKLATWRHFLTFFCVLSIASNFASDFCNIFQYFADNSGGSAAEAEPLELKLGELCMVFYQQSSTPCYLCRGAAD